MKLRITCQHCKDARYDANVPHAFVSAAVLCFHANHEGHRIHVYLDEHPLYPAEYENTHHLHVACAREDCSKEPRTREAELPAALIDTLILQHHAEHGPCGLLVTIDGDPLAQQK